MELTKQKTYQAITLSTIASELSEKIRLESIPKTSQLHLFNGGKGTQLLIPKGSRLFDISPEIVDQLNELINKNDEKGISSKLVALGFDVPASIDYSPLTNPKTYALSLAIAQKCNLGCSYCYAEQGSFGSTAKSMSLETALKSVDFLLKDAKEGETYQLTFLGGEPLVNRSAIRNVTEYAKKKAIKKNSSIRFSITTNGTLLTNEDALFFEKHAFAVTVSLDGPKDKHDAQRPFVGGKGSYDKVIEKIKPLIQGQKKMQVSARVTVTPKNLSLIETLEEFISMGFHSVGFSPLLNSSNGRDEMEKEDLQEMLSSMIECGLAFEKNTLAGKRYPFLNMINALKEISKETNRPYPCGAGAGYLGVSADGELGACHRFVNEPLGYMGNLESGIDLKAQKSWLQLRHVHEQNPCNGCWARYMCGGGCHHEVIAKGRNACDYIRGWLYYTIQAHERLSRMVPDWYKK